MSKKNTWVIAIIVAITVISGSFILRSGKNSPANEANDKQESSKKDPEEHEHSSSEKKGNEPSSEKKEDHESEDKVALSEEQRRASGIVIQKVGAAQLQDTVQLPGEVKLNEDRTAHVVPRLAGIVTGVSADLGQYVKKGQTLAVLSSTSLSESRSELLNAQERLTLARSTYAREKQLWEEKISAQQDFLQAGQALKEAEINARNARQKLVAIGADSQAKGELNRYELRAPFEGQIIEKHLTLGEAVKEDAQVFTLSDLSTVWAEIAIPAKELNRVQVGQEVTVTASALNIDVPGKIIYVGALIGDQTRTAMARVVIKNPNKVWRPGLYITVSVLSGQSDVPVAVSNDAIQSNEGKTIVFVQTPEGFVAQAVKVGRKDKVYTEILEGLKPGMSYAAANSFVLKAELGKGSAEHDH